MLLKIITNRLKKVLFTDDKNMQQVHNICCSGIKTDFKCNFFVMILTRTGLHNCQPHWLFSHFLLLSFLTGKTWQKW